MSKTRRNTKLNKYNDKSSSFENEYSNKRNRLRYNEDEEVTKIDHNNYRNFLDDEDEEDDYEDSFK